VYCWQVEFGPPLFDNDAYRERFSSCSLVVGMHPDQATDAIVDSAIEYGRPWAVVPCCVFTYDFPHRRTPSGDPVQSYEQLIEYLVAKHPDAKTAYLPFVGRNQVVYHTGPSLLGGGKETDTEGTEGRGTKRPLDSL